MPSTPAGLFARLRGLLASRGRPDVLSFTAETLAVHSASGVERARFSWARVAEVRAFKRDALSTDLICLELRVEPEGWYLIHEDMTGFDEVVERLPDLLPGALAFEEWFSGVAYPPFEPNPTGIFLRRDPTSPNLSHQA